MYCGDITTALCTQFGTTQGFSERNVRRWCAKQGLVRDFCPDSQLEVEIAESITEVGFFIIHLSQLPLLLNIQRNATLK